MPKLLIVGDGPGSAGGNTGFSRVTEAVGTRLAAKGWDVSVLAINYYGDAHDYPMKLFPAHLGGDPFGYGRLPGALYTLKPDVVLLFNDLPLIRQYHRVAQEAIANVGCKVVAYTPIDATGHTKRMVSFLGNFDEVVTYTEFGKKEIERVFNQQTPEIKVIGHGVDTAMFFPVDKIEARRQLGLNQMADSDTFIVLNANRNQPRKRQDLTIKGFVKFLAKEKRMHGAEPNAALYMHMEGGHDSGGWGIMDLFMRVCDEEEVDGFQRIILPPPGFDNQNAFPVDKLNLVYNACDLGINTAGAEGWGLVSCEHAATGRPQVVTGYASLRELFEEGLSEYTRGFVLEPKAMQTNPPNNLEHAVVSTKQIGDVLHTLYHWQPEDLKVVGESGRKHILQEKYSWDYIANQWDELLTGVLRKEV